MRKLALLFLMTSCQMGVTSEGRSAVSITVPSVGASAEVVLPIGPLGEHHSFPQIKNWNSLQIRLERTACFGSCPDYSVEIRGDGTFRYQGRYCVSTKGPRSGRLTHDQVAKLYDQFRRADFFSLRLVYSEGVVDAPGIQLLLKFDGWTRNVIDLDDTSGMPPQAAALPNLIDSAVDSKRWIGNPGPKWKC